MHVRHNNERSKSFIIQNTAFDSHLNPSHLIEIMQHCSSKDLVKKMLMFAQLVVVVGHPTALHATAWLEWEFISPYIYVYIYIQPKKDITPATD